MCGQSCARRSPPKTPEAPTICHKVVGAFARNELVVTVVDPGEIKIPVYARVNGAELQVGTLRVIPDVNAAVDIDVDALMVARQTVKPE